MYRSDALCPPRSGAPTLPQAGGCLSSGNVLLEEAAEVVSEVRSGFGWFGSWIEFQATDGNKIRDIGSVRFPERLRVK
jgi:hypothetical protein